MSGPGKFRALLPAEEDAARQDEELQVAAGREGSRASVAGSPAPSSSTVGVAKSQSRTLSACLQCRKSKAKTYVTSIQCTGTRPSCRRCLETAKPCEYDADPDVTPSLTIKRRNHELFQENHDLRELLALLSRGPLHEADRILQRMRDGGDPLAVVRALRNAAAAASPVSSPVLESVAFPAAGMFEGGSGSVGVEAARGGEVGLGQASTEPVRRRTPDKQNIAYLLS